MPQDEQSQPRRPKTNTGERETSVGSQYARAVGKQVETSTRTDRHEADLFVPPRSPSSVIRRGDSSKAIMPRATGTQVSPVPIQTRRQSQQPDMKNPLRSSRTTTSQPSERKLATHKSIHWLFPVGIGMIAMLVLWMVGASVLAWGIQRYNDYRYGIPRTFQMDAVVGHGGDSRQHPSHFIAMNLWRAIRPSP